MKVEDIMTGKVTTLSPGDTIAKAVNKLAEKGISGAPVVDENGMVVGMLTERDILVTIKTMSRRIEMVYPSLSTLSVAFVEKQDIREALDAFTDIAGTSISDIMAKKVLYAEKGTDLGVVVEMMNKRNVNRIPIMDSGKLVGIISRADILKGLAKGMLKE